ncbi:hypothetical protein N7530_009628 [Penicillium desertorum]|uniref:Uncharacterized protein n=1 Tax=Penicillium desertorum TaxID=1303715 RepID=A0A9W9WIZ0_9EURO|nr:hypothetical protein N7530_009628 [Penicillium desertorum]
MGKKPGLATFASNAGTFGLGAPQHWPLWVLSSCAAQTALWRSPSSPPAGQNLPPRGNAGRAAPDNVAAPGNAGAAEGQPGRRPANLDPGADQADPALANAARGPADAGRKALTRRNLTHGPWRMVVLLRTICALRAARMFRGGWSFFVGSSMLCVQLMHVMKLVPMIKYLFKRPVAMTTG